MLPGQFIRLSLHALLSPPDIDPEPLANRFYPIVSDPDIVALLPTNNSDFFCYLGKNHHCNLGLQALTGGNLSLSNKKQREIYVGNLTIGVVVDTMLRDLFNGALAHLVPDPVANPPVINAALDPSGVTTLFAFIFAPNQDNFHRFGQVHKSGFCICMW